MPRTRVTLVAGVALFAAACTSASGSAVRVTIQSSGFRPGCVEVIAADAKHPGDVEYQAKTRFTPPAGADGTLVVAVYGKKGWGKTLAITANLYEGSCAFLPLTRTETTTLPDHGVGADVAFVFNEKDLDGDGFVDAPGHDCDDTAEGAAIHPGAVEQCADVKDVDCDGRFHNGIALDADCVSAGCQGTTVCGADGGSMCGYSGPVVAVYPDEDEDSHGDRAATPFQGCVGAKQSTTHDDCNDHEPAIHPGALELCDSVDNDCSEVADDHLPASESWFVDDDLDQFGNPDAGLRTCAPPPGYVRNATDCDDGDPFTRPGAPELCDLRDNNCNGTVDDGNCGVVAWTEFRLGPDTQHLHTASATDAGVVWTAGTGGTGYVNRDAGFITGSGPPCTGYTATWNGSWTDPTSGIAYLSGDDSMLARVNGPMNCTPVLGTDAVFGADQRITGVVGLRGPLGVLSLYAVSANGRSARWDGEQTLNEALTVANFAAEDVHGISPSVMFTVGTLSGHPAVLRYQPSPAPGRDPSWSTELLPGTLPSANGAMHAVFVVNDHLAYATGDNSVLLEWNGATWRLFPVAPPMDDYGAILAFGRNRIFTVTRRKLREFNGTQWLDRATLPGGEPGAIVLWDVTGPSPDNLWVVGSAGYGYRFPTPP